MKIQKYLFFVCAVLSTVPAFAGWEYDGYYIKDADYTDDGSRFVIGGYGGVSFAKANIKNEMGSLFTDYYLSDVSGSVISGTQYAILSPTEQDEYGYIGIGNVADLPAAQNLSKTAFAAGGYIGFTIPYHPQWRLQAGLDHISEISYDRIPLFEGELSLTSGDRVHVYSSGVKSTLTTDVVSAMVVYDFFDGNEKQLNTFIPYIGVGAGYAMSKTTLKLTDIFGDLTGDGDLDDFGSVESGRLVFDNPTDPDKYPTSNNIAILGVIGASYGISKYTFLDFGARFMYVPKVTWAIANSDGSQHRNWFSAENMIYTNLMVGLRFEF